MGIGWLFVVWAKRTRRMGLTHGMACRIGMAWRCMRTRRELSSHYLSSQNNVTLNNADMWPEYCIYRARMRE